jgi:hypothetical protein
MRKPMVSRPPNEAKSVGTSYLSPKPNSSSPVPEPLSVGRYINRQTRLWKVLEAFIRRDLIPILEAEVGGSPSEEVRERLITSRYGRVLSQRERLPYFEQLLACDLDSLREIQLRLVEAIKIDGNKVSISGRHLSYGPDSSRRRADAAAWDADAQERIRKLFLKYDPERWLNGRSGPKEADWRRLALSLAIKHMEPGFVIDPAMMSKPKTSAADKHLEHDRLMTNYLDHQVTISKDWFYPDDDGVIRTKDEDGNINGENTPKRSDQGRPYVTPVNQPSTQVTEGVRIHLTRVEGGSGMTQTEASKEVASILDLMDAETRAANPPDADLTRLLLSIEADSLRSQFSSRHSKRNVNDRAEDTLSSDLNNFVAGRNLMTDLESAAEAITNLTPVASVLPVEFSAERFAHLQSLYLRGLISPDDAQELDGFVQIIIRATKVHE